MELPKKVGTPTELFPMRWNKTALSQNFTNPRTGKTDSFTVFHSPCVAQNVMGITTAGEVVVSRQFRYGIATSPQMENGQALNDEFPGGGVDPKETWEGAAQREFLEETGYMSKEFIKLSDKLWIDPATGTMTCISWLAFGCTKVVEPEHGPTEFMTIELVPIRTWYANIFNGAVRDLRAIAISLLALPDIKKRGLLPETFPAQTY